MLDDAEHAAGLQRGVHRLERLALPAEHHPVVQVAERHDQVGRTGRRDLALRGRRGERGHDDLVVEIGARRRASRESHRRFVGRTRSTRDRDARRRAGRARAATARGFPCTSRRPATPRRRSCRGAGRRTAASRRDGGTASRARFSAERWARRGSVERAWSQVVARWSRSQPAAVAQQQLAANRTSAAMLIRSEAARRSRNRLSQGHDGYLRCR